MFEKMPRAREESLIIVPLHDETLVYDSTRHKAMCLNRPVAAIWKQCDGQSGIGETLLRLREEIGESINEEIVELGLHQLHRHHLLEGARSFPETHVDIDAVRRALMKLGIAAALLPLIAEVTAPTAAQTGSPGPTGPTGSTGPTGPTGATGPP